MYASLVAADENESSQSTGVPLPTYDQNVQNYWKQSKTKQINQKV